MAKVSVIVPVYKVEKYLEKCLESLVNQTLSDIEIVIVNDGSPDNSEKIIEIYSKRYPNKIKYVKKQNGGLSSARNYGIPYATGEYIAFLDSDDYVELNMYELMYDKAIEDNYDMVECNFIWEYTNKAKIDIGEKYKGTNEALEKARVVAWNKLYRRDVLINSNILFPEGLRYEDVEFFYKILPSLNKIGFVDNAFIHYVQRDNSISNTQNERTKEIFNILDNVLIFYKNNELYEKYKEELEYTYTRYLLCSSLKRMVKVKDKVIRDKLLSETWIRLNENFPHWKKNSILQKKRIKNLYMRSINKLTLNIYCKLFQVILN